jgi:hypothetical protein
LVGTATVCVVAAFGAAFLLARAVGHQGTARAASPPHVAAALTTTTDSELADQFAPEQVALKRPQRRPQHRHPAAHHHQSKPGATGSTGSAASSTAATVAPGTTQATPAPSTDSQPAYTAPASGSGSSTGTGSSSGSTTHHHKSSGSGTTTIG